MADFCPSCSTQHQEDYLACPKTGRPLREGVQVAQPQATTQWQHKNLVIPLNVSTRHVQYADAQQRVEQLILEALRRAGAEGWQAETPMDTNYLERSGALKIEDRWAFLDCIRWVEYL